MESKSAYNSAEILEVDSSQADALAIDALQTVYGIANEEAYYEAERNSIIEQQRALSERCHEVGARLIAVEHRMHRALEEGRKKVWEAADTNNGYAVGTEIIANAVRLSSPDDKAESILLREARVRVLNRLSGSIQVDVPTLIVRAPQHSQSPETYYAGIPAHDGFSVTLEDDPEDGKQFSLGINGHAVVPIADALLVDAGAADLYEYREASVTPLLEVYTGDDVPMYIADIVTAKTTTITEAASSIESLDASEKQSKPVRVGLAREILRRNKDRQALVGIITAAQQVGIQVAVENNIQQQAIEAISEYLLDIGDDDASGGGKYHTLIEAGFALQYIYPTDAQASMAEYLIGKSNRRTQELYSRHYVHPVVSVLQEVCGLNGSIPPNLLLKRS